MITMKACNWTFILTGVLAAASIKSQAQTVSEPMSNLIVAENFDSSGSQWTTLADAENLFIIQEGEYILQRKASNAPYAVLSGFEPVSIPFRMLTALKIDKVYGETSFVGVMFMMQPQGQGGFLVEFNNDEKYRIRQIVSGAYRYLTGDQKEGGWIKHSALKEPGEYNIIEIKAAAGNYDVFFNGKFIQSCAERSYKSGETGIIIGPSTRAKSDYFYLFGPDLPAVQSPDENPVSKTNETENEIVVLTESIIALKTEINTLKEENEGLRKTVSAMRSGEAEQQVTLKNYEKQVKNLEAEIKRKQATADSLQRVNNDLQKYKEMVGANGSGDLVITLSKALKTEKEKTAAFEKQIQELKQQKAEPGKKPAPPEGSKPEKKEAPQGTIILPDEN